MPKVVVNETVAVMFELRNNLKINLLLNDATLLWKYVDSNGEVTNEVVSGEDTFGDIVECSTLNELNLAPSETYKIRFSLIPKRCGGQLSILGLSYRLSSSIEASNNSSLIGKQLFEIRGPRLNNNKSAMSSVVYDVDNRLNLKIMNKSAQLQVEMDSVPETMLCNQLERIGVYFINLCDEVPIGNIRIASNGIGMSRVCFSPATLLDNERVLKLDEIESSEFKFKKAAAAEPNAANVNNSFRNEPIKLNYSHKHHNDSDINSNANSLASGMQNVYSLENVVVEPKGCYQLDMWIRAPETDGEHKFYFMVFYEDYIPDKKINLVTHLKYRTIRYELTINTQKSISNTNLNIINSQVDSNLLLNFELSNLHQQLTFDLINSISASNVWQVAPINSRRDQLVPDEALLSFDQNKLGKKVEDTFSVVLRAKLIQNADKSDKIHLVRASFDLSDDGIPDKNVLLNFIKSDLKNQLSKCSADSGFLDINFIWRTVIKTNVDTTVIKYGLLPVEVIKGSHSSTAISNPSPQRSDPILDLSLSSGDANNINNLLLVVSQCKSSIKCNFKQKNLCSCNVSIELKNLSSNVSFDLILIAKNPRSFEIEKSYLWLGCTKRYVNLNKNESKIVKFKLGFCGQGMFEIGRVASDSLLKANIFEASCSTSAAPANNSISLEDYLNDKLSVDNASMTQQNYYSTANQMDSATINFFLKNTFTNRHELFKRLNPFTVQVSTL